MATIDTGPIHPDPLSQPDSDVRVVDALVLYDYIERLLQAMLGQDNQLFLSKSSTLERLAHFAADSLVQAVYIERIKADSGKYSVTAHYSLEQDPAKARANSACIAIIKRVPVLHEAKSLQEQLLVINLPGDADGSNEFSVFHRYLQHAFSPFFDSNVGSLSRDDKDAKMGLSLAKKKVAELELSLVQLQNNVAIPEVVLRIHPEIRQYVIDCHKQQAKPVVEGLGDVTSNSLFLNKLQSDVNEWIKEIQKLTLLDRDPESGSARQEIEFWIALERALNHIDLQLHSDEILLTLDTLRAAKRFHATVSFLADTGIKEKTEKVQRYNQLMKDFPINDLLSSTDLDKIGESILLIFSHINKKFKISPYPIKRMLKLIEAISKDLNTQMLKTLSSSSIMMIPWEEFDFCIRKTDQVFRIWEEQLKEFINVARELVRKRSEKFLVLKINSAHVPLQERLSFVHIFRRQHEDLCSTILKVIKSESASIKQSSLAPTSASAQRTKDLDLEASGAQEDVVSAFDTIRSVNVLDLSPEGTQSWVAAENIYTERIAQVEGQIISRLRDRLASARNATDMFRVFSKFNALFIRPKIRGAIHEYQTQLIERVKEDIHRLHEKFAAQHDDVEMLRMVRLRDLMPISSSVIWARQIERQLGEYMKRVEDVLGRGWEQYAEGQKLSQEERAFKNQLNTRPIFDRWVANISSREINIGGRIFDITRNRARGGELQLTVNFDDQIIAVFKEIRNLLWHQFVVPHPIVNVAKDAKRVYPFAVSLAETVRTWDKTLNLLSQNKSICWLVATYHKSVQTLISKGIQLRWDYFINTYEVLAIGATGENRHAMFVRELVHAVSLFQEKTVDAISITDSINAHVEELATIPYEKSAFEKSMANIQKLISQLSLESYANLSQWTKLLDTRIETILLQRLKGAVKVWISGRFHNPSKGGDNKSTAHLQAPDILVHELRIRNQAIYLDPPLEHARVFWVRQMQRWFGVVGQLRRPRVFEMGLVQIQNDTSLANLDYCNLISRLSIDDIRGAYQVIENMYNEASTYVKKWLQYQSLWDLEPNAVFETLGDDLDCWGKTLIEVKKARSTFDTATTSKTFTNIIIDYDHIQTKVNAQYDQWQRDLLNRFGSKMGTGMRSFHTDIVAARLELEHITIGTSTNDMVSFVIFLEDLRSKEVLWSAQVATFQQGQKILERQRFHFPSNWLYFDQVNADWGALREILTRKSRFVDQQVGRLRERVHDEDLAVVKKMKELLVEWDQNKPIYGEVKPSAAISILQTFEARITSSCKDFEQLSRAKKALKIDGLSKNYLEHALDELTDLSGVWGALSAIWTALDDVQDTLWFGETSWSIRPRLEALIQQLKDMPNRMRQYAAFEHTHSTLKGYIAIHTRASRLKSDALRERHWDRILSIIGLKSLNHNSLTVGHLWNSTRLKEKEKLIDEVLEIAAGELALEEYLKQTKAIWTSYSLEFTNYQNKCRLVKGWNDLFTKSEDHLAALSAMRGSQHYKVFEVEATLIEEKLTRLHILLEVWIVVQRQWVYLEGIFSGNMDIRQILPIESNRFVSIDAEFMAMLRKVYKSTLVWDVISIPNIQKSMERLADMLQAIQKSLGEYLEKERAKFPRFYFVGDEDLLDILGNSKDITRLQPYFKKMFAGIHSVILSSESLQIEGVCSKEGEQVLFKQPVIITTSTRVHEWLSLMEAECSRSLAKYVEESCDSDAAGYLSQQVQLPMLDAWIDFYPSQVVLLTAQIKWTLAIEKALTSSSISLELTLLLKAVDKGINMLAELVLSNLPLIRRKRCEGLITELVHQRDVIRQLILAKVSSAQDFEWLSQMRFYFDRKAPALQSLSVCLANASFYYGFEYLGLQDRLVQTPLTDRCYLTLAQALHNQLGGSPFGPAGTGKTESVKAMGAQFGRLVLVFCCDENFDFQSMGRIFTGLCQVGAWGCFDEFNRLDERILSAVSQQIQSIQTGLKSREEIDLVGKSVVVQKNTGIFITMNPGYAGRSNLPDNLRKLFRSVAMTVPDRLLIAQVMLFSQGFRHAEVLASKAIPFFDICKEQLSARNHYDFGLRALKSVLMSAGNLQRSRLSQLTDSSQTTSHSLEESRLEQSVLYQSIQETVFPKLVKTDVILADRILKDVFPGIQSTDVSLAKLKQEIIAACDRHHLIVTDQWLEKVVQLYNIQNIHHGVMIVGPSGSGKSLVRKVLFEALDKIENADGHVYILEPKSSNKDKLYGFLDATTREWTDGVFTHILRKIIDDVRGESSKRHWIIFDGDVDPEWVENLNSVLDDNKMLTLPNGERLRVPPNVRILFEVEDLLQATPATISRCGMVWFSDDLVTPQMLADQYLKRTRSLPIDDDFHSEVSIDGMNVAGLIQPAQLQVADLLEPMLQANGILSLALNFAASLDHVMLISKAHALSNLFSLMNAATKVVLRYNSTHSDFPLAADALENYITKSFYINLVWSFGGSAPSESRQKLAEFVSRRCTMPLPTLSDTVLDFDVDISSGTWVSWSSVVPIIDIDPQTLTRADVVVPTIDTLRHEKILMAWLTEHRPVILCGPPGSGKTMTLLFALRKMAEIDVIPLNFSSETTPEMILRVLELNCEYRKTSNSMILSPKDSDRWLVLFCDEINLPRQDKYGTQRVISFMRQLIEHGGFWRFDRTWVDVQRIQFVGACNPPTDPGRIPLTPRFLRHAPVVFVDYPGQESLITIYSTFARACLKVHPNLRGYAEALTGAMVEFFINTKKRFTPDIQPHYIYSPRELSRWIRGIYEIIHPIDFVSIDNLIRTWAHEGLRLYQDRLVDDEEKMWTDTELNAVASRYFPGTSVDTCLQRPILYSDFLSKHYVSVDRNELRDFIKARLQVFYEEELDIPLVLFDKALEHILRIDRVFRQSQGHMLIIGISGSGKTTLTRFVAWMNGINVFQANMHSKYTASDFDDDLRTLLRRSGCKGEKLCFILDEGSIFESSFIERMNTLLANAEIPGLFEGDEFTSLMSACKEASQREGLTLDLHDELYQWFKQQVMRNLHIVFTMNPPDGSLTNWYGDWDTQAFFQVGQDFTHTLDLDDNTFVLPPKYITMLPGLNSPITFRDTLLDLFVYVHQLLRNLNEKIKARQSVPIFVTPRQFLDFVTGFVHIYRKKRFELEERQRHLIVGLDKLRDTVLQVEELRSSLAVKKSELEKKTIQANEKLEKMVEDQQEAESKRSASMQIQTALVEQNAEIESRRKVVLADLEKAEPAVLEAQESVRGIKKQHLTEVRSMGNPPSAVKMAMESVCILLGNKVDSWKAVQAVLRRDDFISSIVNYETGSLSRKIRNEIFATYLSDPNFTFETVNRASKACGPLVQWVIAQYSYAEILEKVGPLREEVQQLEQSAEETKQKASSIDQMISELEQSIGVYKGEYAVLISETQMLKQEMQLVKDRVDRSMRVLDNLSSERGRWEESRESFGQQMETLVGDVLLASAFLAYAGYYDQKDRMNLLQTWKNQMQSAGVRYNLNLSLPEYLASTEERASWIKNSLPADNLCIENAVMLKQCQRYPLVIDPSGQALVFILNEFKTKSITVTSFRDNAFLKTVESALRFGNPILIQDAEDFDPVINSILNKELRRSGGRTLCRLGNKEIDYSPTFTMFLSTRNPSLAFSPDIASRVTFVNFTITPASLQLQCLDHLLKAERPDVDAKRTDLVRMQGEFQIRLHHLEKALLISLNESKGNILDDDNVISTLEVLKKEASEIVSKVQETDIIMQEVEAVSSQYTLLAESCSSIYFAMEQLSSLESIYQFALNFFFEIFEKVLKNNPRLAGKTSKAARLEILEQDMFMTAFQRVSRSLRQHDILVFGMLIAQIKQQSTSAAITETEFLFLLHGSNSVVHQGGSTALDEIVGHDAACKLSELCQIKPFSELEHSIIANKDTWRRLVHSELRPEEKIPVCWKQNDTHDASSNAFYSLLIIKCIRPDRLMESLSLFFEAVFGSTFPIISTDDKLARVIEETTGVTPIILCSDSGYDTSSRVEILASQSGQRLVSVALGSNEGFKLAETAIAGALQSTSWVLLKNAHLSLSWLSQLEKKLHSFPVGSTLKLFLTLEISSKLPLNLLRRSRNLVFEPPAGIKASMSESLSSIPQSLILTGPSEKTRLFFMLSWLHAIILERLRYLPVGWTKSYDFNDADYDMALHLIDAWLVNVSNGKSSISPKQIPWTALKSLISQNVYGGKIDVVGDQKTLDVLVDEIFTPAIFEREFVLVDGVESSNGLEPTVMCPDGIKLEQFSAWVNELKDTLPPSWIGLPADSDILLKQFKSTTLLSKLRCMNERLSNVENSAKTGNPSNWSTTMRELIKKWLDSLPKNLPEFNAPDATDPLMRFIGSETETAAKLLATIRSDLTSLDFILVGKDQHTNSTRLLTSLLRRGEVPKHWISYTIPTLFTINQFLDNLVERLKQVKELQESAMAGQLESLKVWIGGLFFPEAFLTAARQTAAKLIGASLENLELAVMLDPTTDTAYTQGGMRIEMIGLKLEGAKWTDKKLDLVHKVVPDPLPPLILAWRQLNETKTAPSGSPKTIIHIPVYLNSDRKNILFYVNVLDPRVALLTKRAIAVTAL
ncbi:dynein heavy chain [Batrachochytrium dendrobatidis]